MGKRNVCTPFSLHLCPPFSELCPLASTLGLQLMVPAIGLTQEEGQSLQCNVEMSHANSQEINNFQGEDSGKE